MKQKLPRWYFGGIASAMGVCITHPLDLLKVHLQTHTGKKVSLVGLGVNVVKSDGARALYSGLSASIFRQLTYSTARFGIFDTAKLYLGPESSLVSRIGVALVAGAIGGCLGTPGDKVNVRMQNDVKLPKDQRWHYKHVLDGLVRIHREEGAAKLFGGGSAASYRAALMAVGQICSYDQLKLMMLRSGEFEDNLQTHFVASIGAGFIATTITQPLDVMKTRLMNAPAGQFKGLLDVALFTTKEGPLGFFKGFVPAFLRLAPQTILTFVFYEQLRMEFGYYQE